MRELSQIDQELRQVRRDLDRAGKLDAMLADLGKQHLQQRKKAAEAFDRFGDLVAPESEDISEVKSQEVKKKAAGS